ncbi:MAG: hypothetical protein AB8B72_13885, partial [Crocinitomicaceae bacterium]
MIKLWRKIILTIFLLLPFVIIGQNNEQKSNIYDFNHFSLEFQTGFNRTQFFRETGPEDIDDRIERVLFFNMGYQFNIGKRFGIEVNGGFGLQPRILSFEAIRLINFDGLSPSISVRSSTFFARFGMNVNYHQQLNNSKWRFDASLGLAYSGNTGGLNSVTVIPSDNMDDWYEFSYEFEDLPIAIIPVKIGFTKELDNRNLLGLYLVGEYYSQPLMKGLYQFQNVDINGSMLNNGTTFGFKLRYSLTTAARKDERIDILTARQNTRMEEKKIRIQKRNINPEGLMISGGTGLFFARNFNTGSIATVKNAAAPSWIGYLKLEKGFGNNNFYEMGLSAEEHWSCYRIVGIARAREQRSQFISSTGSFGIGRRFFRAKTNWNFLTVSTGAAVSSRMDFINYGWSGSSSSKAPYRLTKTESDITLKSPIFFTLYLNLQHDIQLSKNMFLSLNYRYNQGFISTLEESAKFTLQPDG